MGASRRCRSYGKEMPLHARLEFGDVCLFLFLIAIFALSMLASGCDRLSGFPDLSRQAGYRAPADFTKGVGEVRFWQSEDGRTVFWEVPYNNPTNSVMLATVSPAVTVKDEAGRIVWSGSDTKSWAIPPLGQGFEGGKIVIPASAIKPTLKWENGGATSAAAER
jgi:hypothetical protein